MAEESVGKIQWLKYVPHDELVVHLASGWAVSDDLYGTNHGFYSCLMVWMGEDECRRCAPKVICGLIPL